MSGYTKQCKACGVRVWETYPGAHTETSETGEDYCDGCEEIELTRRARIRFVARREAWARERTL